MKHPRLILASSSAYRQSLLAQLSLRFEVHAPGVDETPLAGEAPAEIALRLGLAKAAKVLADIGDPDSLVIGSDQVCHLAGRIFGKPGNEQSAIEQLQALRGHRVTFSTSLVLLSGRGPRESVVEDFEVQFRMLSDQQIRDYVALDAPLDCAGAVKIEQAGISLISDTRGRDINALYGLPLMALTDAIEALGYTLNDFR